MFLLSSPRNLAIPLVLLSAVLHAAWNALLKHGGTHRAQFMASMSFITGCIALLCLPFVPYPGGHSFVCVLASAVLHLCYNLLLLQNYRTSDFANAYPIARGVSPLLVTLGAFFLLRQQPSVLSICGVVLISAAILFLATGATQMSPSAFFSTLATGAVIAAYTVVDGLGVQRSPNVISYSAFVFATYLLMPPTLWLLRMPVRVLDRGSFRSSAGAGVLSLAAYTLVLWATHYAPVGLVSALRETSVLWAVVFASMFLGEAFSRRRIVSACLIMTGIFLLVRPQR